MISVIVPVNELDFNKIDSLINPERNNIYVNVTFLCTFSKQEIEARIPRQFIPSMRQYLICSVWYLEICVGLTSADEIFYDSGDSSKKKMRKVVFHSFTLYVYIILYFYILLHYVSYLSRRKMF